MPDGAGGGKPAELQAELLGLAERADQLGAGVHARRDREEVDGELLGQRQRGPLLAAHALPHDAIPVGVER